MFKKYVAVIISIIVLFCFSLSVSAVGTVYNDSITGVTFTVPDGWKEDEFYEDREFLKAKFTPVNEDGSTMMFGYSDMWSELSASEKAGYTRADIDHNFMKNELAGEDISTFFGIGAEDCISDSILYNGTEYMRLKYSTAISAFGVSVDMTMIMLYHFHNGYMIGFQYCDLDNNPHYTEFETMMNSVRYPTVSSSIGSVIDDNESDITSSIYIPSYDYDINNDSYATDDTSYTGKDSDIVYFEDGKMKFDFPLLIINLIITIVIYSLPIIIYRYAIKKQPLPEKKAKKVTIIYGIIAFIVMAVVSGAAPGAAIILWSTVNYNMLKKPSKHDVYVDNAIYSENCAITDTTRIDETVTAKESEIVGYTEENFDETVPQVTETITDEQKPEQSLIVEEAIVDAPKSNELQKPIESTNNVSFCRKCGTRLTAESEFCHKCGTRVLK